MAVTIRIKRGTATQWASRTTPLLSGEFGYDLTNKITKIGDGTTLWDSLPSIGSSSNSEGLVTDSELTTAIQGANEYTDTAVSGLGNSLDGQYVLVADVGNLDGVAPLDENGLIPDLYIPDSIARDSEIITSYNNLLDLPALFSGDYADLNNKPTIALGAVAWTENHYQLEGGANTRYLAGDIVWHAGNIYVANFDNESLPTSNTEYWSLIGIGNRLNIDGRDIPNILWENILEKPTIPDLTGYATETYVGTAISNLVDTAPETLNTLNELAAALGDDANFASTVSTALGTKAPIASPTFTGTVTIPSGASISGYAPIASPTFTGTVGGITKSMVGLGNVDNTTDANKPVSTATQTALNLKVNTADPAVDYYITNSGSGAYLVNGVSNGTIYFEKGKKYRIHVNASGHPFWIQTSSGAYNSGNVYSTGITNNGAQSGHIIVELPLNAPQLYYACQFHSSMTGSIVTGTTFETHKALSNLSNVDNTSDANKPVSGATQTALNLKSNIDSPTFTGTVGGITKSMVGLANVDNTSDSNKPVSTATQTALDLKLNLSDPSVDYYITNSGSGAYLVNGVSNGLITFEKGKKYRIHINASGHPFWIQTVSGAYSAGNVYSAGITNGGAQVGHILVELPQNAPDNLYYACQFHSSMQGSISVQSSNTITTNAQASNYTIAPIDSGRLIEMSGGGTLTITDSASFPVGFTVDVLQTGSSQVTIAGNGFTPNSTPGLKLRAQWSSATLIKRALNSWVVLGDLSA